MNTENLYLGGTGSTIDVVDVDNEDGLTDGVIEAIDLDTLDVIALKFMNNFYTCLLPTYHQTKLFTELQF